MAKAKTAPRTKAKAKTSKNKKSSFLNKVLSLAQRPMVLLSVFVVMFGLVGAYSVLESNAATSYLSSRDCTLRGRIYTGATATNPNPCSNKCYPAGTGQSAGYLIYTTPYNYCSNAVTRASTSTTITKCQALGRVWLSGTGCARYWPRINNAYNVPQCAKSYQYYRLASTSTGYDYCWPYKY
jgi:hypothetical protein